MSETAAARPAWRIVGGPAPEGPYTELRAVARRLELDYRGAPVLSFTVNGMPVQLALDFDSGVVSGLSMRVTLERAGAGDGASIKLRRENREDREGKTRGINREVQLEDKPFDDAVYVDATATDAEVRRILAKPSRRQAVLALLQTTGKVEVSAQAVSAIWSKASPRSPFEPANVLEALRQLLTLAGAGGPRQRGPWRRGVWLQALAGLSVFATPMYLLFVLVAWEFDGFLVFLGLGAGLLLALGLRPLVAWLTKGDPGSFSRYRSTAATLGFSLVMLGGGVPVHMNAALDGSGPVRVEEGRVVRVGDYDDENGTHRAEVAWSDGTPEKVDLRPPVQERDVVVKRVFRGALGFRWAEHPRVAGSPSGEGR